MSDDVQQPRLTVPSRCQRFVAGGLDGHERLAERLRESDAVGPVLLERPDNLLLDDEGRVGGRHRLTAHALSQLCGLLAPGLTTLVGHLSGQAGRAPAALAIRLINAMIRMSFDDKLAGRGLILDRAGGRVEGLVSPRYRFYANTDLLSRMGMFVSGQSPPGSFWRASLSGRRLSLYHMSTRPLFRRENLQYHLGWYAVNSEIGDNSIRAGLSLVSTTEQTAAIWEVGSVIHTQGPQFDQKLESLFERLQLAPRRLSTKELIAGMRRLSAKELAIDDSEQSPVRQRLIRRLVDGGDQRPKLPRDVAEAVAGMLAMRRPGAPQTRCSQLDLYTALGAVASRSAPRQQEAAERVAGSLLCRPRLEEP